MELVDKSQYRRVGALGDNDLPTVRSLNALLSRCWQRGLLPEPTLDPDRLIAEAIRAEKAEPRDGAWVASYRLLTADLARSAALNPLGRTVAHGQISKLLRQRIRADRLLRHRPEIMKRPIEAPVIIVGHMRSGTTRLHRLLACDPRFATTRLHETLTPLPRATAAAVTAAALTNAFLRRCNPALKAIHPTHATAAEEEFGLLGLSFDGAMFEAQWHVPAFARHCEQRDAAPVYQDFRRLLQILSWRRREAPGWTLLLKVPQFLQDMAAVLDCFPDARILHMSRAPEKVVASSASLVWNQQRLQSDDADPHRIGREWLRKTGLRERRADAALAARSDAARLPIAYDAMSDDWRREVTRIYGFLGLSLEPALLSRMAATVRKAHSHHGHRYTLAQFGLRPEDVSRGLAA